MKSLTTLLRSSMLLGLLALTFFASSQSAMATEPGIVVTVKKTVEPFLVRSIDWTIDKSVSPDLHDLLAGESAVSGYSVSVTKSVTDSGWFITGDIVVANRTAAPVTLNSLTDMVEGGFAATVVCPAPLPHVIPPDPNNAINKIKCTYSVALPDGSTRVNTATANVDGVDYIGTETVDFSNASITVEGFGTINVQDTNGEAWMTSDSATWNYDRTFTCSTDPALYVDGMYTFTHPNTAKIVETGQDDDALVTVKCRMPPPPPPPGGQGCTPGYWKQPQHFDSWVPTGYAPANMYHNVFGVPYVKTLLQALETGGGGARALGRHATAALLNASHPDVSYFYTPAQIIGMVQNAYATGNFEGAKNALEYQNELGCPLN